MMNPRHLAQCGEVAGILMSRMAISRERQALPHIVLFGRKVTIECWLGLPIVQWVGPIVQWVGLGDHGRSGCAAGWVGRDLFRCLGDT